MLRFLIVALVALPSVASAAERRVPVGSFDRLRVSGGYEVKVATGRGAQVTLAGASDALDRVDVALEGTTLVIRPRTAEFDERHAAASTPIAITLSTPALAAVSSIAGGRIVVTRMTAPRVDLSLSGAGSIAVNVADAEQLNATVIGVGGISVGGRARTARLTANGPSTIDAIALTAGDLFVRLDGPGAIRATARYSAQVNNMGLGKIEVAGKPKCIVRSAAGGPVVCGVPGTVR